MAGYFSHTLATKAAGLGIPVIDEQAFLALF
jgi:hypothetical protein